MIKGIYVIHDNGICIYNKSLIMISPNDQLFSGFISALDRFCTKSIGEKISYFCTETLKFHFIHDNKLIFIFLSDKNDITKNLLPYFQRLMNEFHIEYSNQRSTFEKDGLIPELSSFDTCVSDLCI